MLSRVADALYWMGRYLERAENTTRLLLVTEETATELVGFDEELARAEWRELAAVFPGPGAPPGPAPAAAHLRAFSIDPQSPCSVAFALRKARENARTVREALTVEVFVTLNQTWQDLAALKERQVADPPTFRTALQATHRGILSTVGAIGHTLSRDEGWMFLRLGECFERLYRTAAILRAKLPALVATAPTRDLPLVTLRWRALLRAISALENYRQVRGARIEPLDVVQFAFFDPHMPRSLRYGTTAVKRYLDQLAGEGALRTPGRLMGRLAAELAYRDDEILRDQDWPNVLDQVLDALTRTHEALSALYFET